MGEEGIEITTEIKHFSQHELTLTHELKNSDKCDACKRPILTSFYNCTQCRFVLHKFCAELPRKKWHPLHQHLLTLSKNPYGSDHIGVACSACTRSDINFSYNCHKCGFDLDVNCSLTSDRLTHDGHEHPLILSSATRSGKCSVCDSEGYVFRWLIAHLLYTLNVLHYQVAQNMNNMSILLLSNTLLKMTPEKIIMIFVKKNGTQNIGIITEQIVIILLILIAFLGK